jgi:Uma2 family endonuclease
VIAANAADATLGVCSLAQPAESRVRYGQLDEGVPEYWIVDLDARAFERWRPADERPEILVEALVWQPRVELEPLVSDLQEYFAAVLD